MTADTQSQIDAIFNQVAQYNQQYDTSKPLFFDTETTGGGREDQIIEIAFCDSDRNVIIDTLIYNDRPSSPGAFKVHGIYPHELIGKPTFIDIQPAIVQLLKGRTLYAYSRVSMCVWCANRDISFACSKLRLNACASSLLILSGNTHRILKPIVILA